MPLFNYNNANTWYQRVTTPVMIFNDQELLNFDAYPLELFASKLLKNVEHADEFRAALFNRLNIRLALGDHFLNGYDKYLLGHSEKNSPELAKYEAAGFTGVYWWSHAIIAYDWFRYAETDPTLEADFSKITKDFLIYNRAWAGTREYRLKFAELVVENALVDKCNIKFSPTEDGVNYKQHVYANPAFEISIDNLEDLIPLNTASSSASADYASEDYTDAGIEVVLETLFDDQRNHLTEKTLRAIACGRPFMIASTPGTLQYLRDYGFQTFDGLIDESYDTITDPVSRLEAIVAEMTRISNLDSDAKTALWTALYAIADQNKERFFSDEFTGSVVQEFKTNFDAGIVQVLASKTGSHMKYVKTEWLDKYPDMAEAYYARPHRTMEEFNNFMAWIDAE